MKSTLTLIPSFSLHPNQLNIYQEIHWDPYKPSKYNEVHQTETQERKYEHLLSSSRTAEGKVSQIAKRKILKALNYMLLITNQKTIHNNYSGRHFKFKIAFVTLTLPSQQIHTDNEIKSKLLNQILIELKQVYKVKNYIWRAEKQKNGNIHFHILVDKFIPHQELRDRWNRITNKLGYVDRYRQEQIDWHKNGFRVRENLLKTWSKEKQYQAYCRGSKLQWHSPNSTDIHSVQNIHNLKQYISKYLTKNEIHEIECKLENVDIMMQTGRIWGCNKELMKIKGASGQIDSIISEEIEDLINSGNVKIIQDTYYSVVIFNTAYLLKRPESQLFKLFSQFLIDQFDYHIQTEIAA